MYENEILKRDEPPGVSKSKTPPPPKPLITIGKKVYKNMCNHIRNTYPEPETLIRVFDETLAVVGFSINAKQDTVLSAKQWEARKKRMESLGTNTYQKYNKPYLERKKQKTKHPDEGELPHPASGVSV